MITFKQKGDFSKLDKYLKRAKKASQVDILDVYGKRGVSVLSSATPVDSGKTASSWYYEKEITNKSKILRFCNSNVNDGVSIAIILQYGHGTGTGGWVEGRDYINPAIQPIFDEMVKNLWREVTNA